MACCRHNATQYIAGLSFYAYEYEHNEYSRRQEYQAGNNQPAKSGLPAAWNRAANGARGSAEWSTYGAGFRDGWGGL